MISTEKTLLAIFEYTGTPKDYADSVGLHTILERYAREGVRDLEAENAKQAEEIERLKKALTDCKDCSLEPDKILCITQRALLKIEEDKQ